MHYSVKLRTNGLPVPAALSGAKHSIAGPERPLNCGYEQEIIWLWQDYAGKGLGYTGSFSLIKRLKDC